MVIELVGCRYGAPARRALADAVEAAKRDDPLAPVTVIVTTNAVGVASRRFLARHLGGIAAVEIATVFRVAERLGAVGLARSGLRPLSTPVLTAAVRSALRTEPGIFAGVAGHPATERNMVRIHRELSELDEAELITLAGKSPRAEAVVAIHRAVRDQLRADWHDEHDLVASAIEAAAADPDSAAALGTVVWYLPQRLSAGHGRLARVIAAVTPSTVIAGVTGEDDADRTVRTSLARIGLPAPPVPQEPPPPPALITVASVSDPDDEVRAAVRHVMTRAHAGKSFERMAILHPREIPYERIIHDQLVAAGVPFHAARGRPLAESMPARRLLGFLALHDHDYSRPSVLALLGADPSGRGAEWEAESRRAGIVSGRADWDLRLATHIDTLRTEARTATESRARWSQRAAEDASDLRAAALGAIADLEHGMKLSRWSSLATWCTGVLAARLAPETERSAWPEVELDADRQISGIIHRLATLDLVDEAPTFTGFRRILELELAEGRQREGRVGEGLLFGPLGSAMGVELDLVVIVGLAEGVVPTTPADDSVIPDRERAAVSDALVLRAATAHDQRRQFLAALAEGDETVLVRPRSDLRRTLVLPPSRWIPSEAVTADIGSFVAGIAEADICATAQDRVLQQLMALDPPPAARLHEDAGSLGPLLADTPLRRGSRLVLARRLGRFGRFEGNLSHLRMPSPMDRLQSATQLETWASCPHAYLMRYVLRIAEVEDPEAVEDLSPMRAGSLIHEVLDRFVHGRLDHPMGQPWPAEAAAEIQALADEVFAEAESSGGTGRAVNWRRSQARIRRELDEFLTLDSVRLVDDRLLPAAAELRFGFDDSEEPAIAVPLGPGRTMQVRGAIDRVDRAPGGRLVITDYKTGGSKNFHGLSETNPHGYGTRLQLPLYGMAARQWAHDPAVPVDVGYWFVSEKGAFKPIRYPLSDDALSSSLDAIGEIVTGIERGHFPARPEAPQSYQHFVPCPFCDPDGLGTKDSYQRWLRIRRAPELASYVELVEPSERSLDV